MEISVSNITLPNKPLTNFDIEDTVKKIWIPGFRGMFTRDRLPRKKWKNECGIFTLNDSYGRGTHWVAWCKRNNKKYYFDSYGIQPPQELVSYFKSPVLYNSEQAQGGNDVFCGHLCLYVLKKTY